MTQAEVEQGFKATIDQFYAWQRHGVVNSDRELHYIGGILQSALHILTNDRYYALKQYIYDTYGYDPGGCKTGQISIEEWGGW